MNHPFTKSSDNPNCAICTFDFLSHTSAAKCDICSKFGEVNIHDSMRKCANCIAQHETAMSNIVLDTDTFLRLTRQDEDTAIHYSGDMFNAKTIANQEIRDKIFSDDTLTDELKHQKYFTFLADRYTHFKQVIFDQNKLLHDSNLEVIVISNELREYGNKVREEIRNKIKQADEFYAPAIINKPKVVAKVKAKISPLEKLIKSMMEMTGKTETECRLLVEQGNFGKKEDKE